MARARRHQVNLDRLCTAMQRDRWSMRHFRTERVYATNLYVGAHWSEWADRQKQPVNLLSLYCQIVGRNLIAKEPRVMLSTFDQANKPMVAAMESWANREIVQMRLATTLQRIVLDALFSIGIAKVALATPADSALLSWNLKAGQPFVERVDLDDFVYDVHARDFSEVSYIGHRFRVPLDVVRESKIYSKARKDLAPTTDSPYNLEGDEKISALQRMPYAVDGEEWKDWVDLWEIYLPQERLVLTLHDDYLTGASTVGNSKVEALREQEWIGSDQGPYLILGYLTVPGNAMPKGPIQDLIDLHESVNNCYRKLERQAERLKEVLLVAGNAMEDAGRTQNANDGDIVKNENPERAKPFTFGGPNQALTQIAVHFMDLFMKVGGNLEMLGGLAPQSKTLGQDQLLASNASGGMQDMQARTIAYTADVLKALCWFWWHHPTQTMRSKYQVPGTQGVLPPMVRQVSPQQRMQARWSDLDIEVDPYSLQHQSPQQRAQMMMQVATQVFIPFAQLMQQQGIGFDLATFLQEYGKYMDMPDLSSYIHYAAAPQSEAQPAPSDGMGSPKPTETTRNYVRRSLGGDTPQNREQTMLQNMATNANGQQQRNGRPGMV